MEHRVESVAQAFLKLCRVFTVIYRITIIKVVISPLYYVKRIQIPFNYTPYVALLTYCSKRFSRGSEFDLPSHLDDILM